MRLLPCLLVAAALCVGAPDRRLNYAESESRLIYTYVFGGRDTCRVLRRAAPPVVPVEALVNRLPRADYALEPGDTKIAEFDLGRRPVHIVPTNDGKFLLTFANRAAGGGQPVDDKVAFLEEPGRREMIDYGPLPADTLPEFPPFERALPAEPPKGAAPAPADYAFLARETAPNRLLIARQTESEGHITEMICFLVDGPEGRVALPEAEELKRFLAEKEDLWAAGAAWALGVSGNREAIPALKGALVRVTNPAARCRIAQALVRLDDDSARATLRAVLKEAATEACVAICQLPPDRRDAEALATALVESEGKDPRLFQLALARIGAPALPAILKLASATKADTRAAAASVLGLLDDPDAEARLLKLARDPEASVQLEAAIALTRPPRAILPANHEAYAAALDAVHRSKNHKAALRLTLLAVQSGIRHDAVLKSLALLTDMEAKAIWALQKLTGLELQTADDWRAWAKQKPAGGK